MPMIYYQETKGIVYKSDVIEIAKKHNIDYYKIEIGLNRNTGHYFYKIYTNG